jgi:hypothetical protein
VLGHKLIDVVVEAVVYAVDVGEPTVPACPLTINYPTLSERRHFYTIGMQTLAEVEVLYLYLMLACCHASTDILVLTDGAKGGIVLDPAQHVRYTGDVHKITPYGPGLGVLPTPPGPSRHDTYIVPPFGLVVNILS